MTAEEARKMFKCADFDANSALENNKKPEPIPNQAFIDAAKRGKLKSMGIAVGQIKQLSELTLRVRCGESIKATDGKSLIVNSVICVPPDGYFPPTHPDRSHSLHFFGNLAVTVSKKSKYADDTSIINVESSMDAFCAGLNFIRPSTIDTINNLLDHAAKLAEQSLPPDDHVVEHMDEGRELPLMGRTCPPIGEPYVPPVAPVDTNTVRAFLKAVEAGKLAFQDITTIGKLDMPIGIAGDEPTVVTRETGKREIETLDFQYRPDERRPNDDYDRIGFYIEIKAIQVRPVC